MVEKFLVETDDLAFEFTALLAEALGLNSHELTGLFEPRNHMQHRSKVFRRLYIQMIYISNDATVRQISRSSGRGEFSRCRSTLRHRLFNIRARHPAGIAINQLIMGHKLLSSFKPLSTAACKLKTLPGTGSMYHRCRTPLS